jgi:hypothetical protein
MRGFTVPDPGYLHGSGRTLERLGFRISAERDARVPEAQIADPEAPIDSDQLTRQLAADDEKTPVKKVAAYARRPADRRAAGGRHLALDGPG